MATLLQHRRRRRVQVLRHHDGVHHLRIDLLQHLFKVGEDPRYSEFLGGRCRFLLDQITGGSDLDIGKSGETGVMHVGRQVASSYDCNTNLF